ncbi:MAG: rhodanese-like domain-containing protein [Pirellula sp.]|jgi:rhodanese-related sulfurtransferase
MEIDVNTAKCWLDRGTSDDGLPVVFIDCREPSEVQTASIPGTELAPMSQWPPPSDQTDTWSGKQIVVFCHHGGRSLRVAMWMRQNGFPNSLSMAGGIDRWSLDIDPLVPRY